jgi:hypothetical protein
MGTFYGGLAHVPISSLIMVSEMPGSYDLLVPLMLAEGGRPSSQHFSFQARRGADTDERASGRSLLGRNAGRAATFRTRLEIQASRQNRKERTRRRPEENWSGSMVASHAIAIATTVLFQAVAGNGQKRKNERMIPIRRAIGRFIRIGAR